MTKHLTRITERFELKDPDRVRETLQSILRGENTFIDEAAGYSLGQRVSIDETPCGKCYLVVKDSTWTPVHVGILLRALIQTEPAGTEWFTSYSYTTTDAPYPIHTGGVMCITRADGEVLSAGALYAQIVSERKK